jgi:hypothetical protein
MEEALSQKICKQCLLPVDIEKFNLRPSGKRVDICNKCRHQNEYAHRKENPELTKKYNDRSNEWARNNRDCQVVKGSRGHDKAAGRNVDCDNYIDRDWVKNIFEKQCYYCAVEQATGVDRIDSAISHTKDNCVPCCHLCNHLKRDMPYEAWMILVPAVRQAMIAGAFGNWIGGTKGRK